MCICTYFEKLMANENLIGDTSDMSINDVIVYQILAVVAGGGGGNSAGNFKDVSTLFLNQHENITAGMGSIFICRVDPRLEAISVGFATSNPTLPATTEGT